jgi:hypothetical protein
MANRAGQRNSESFQTKFEQEERKCKQYVINSENDKKKIAELNAKIAAYEVLDYKSSVANAEEAALRLELDNLEAKNADLEAQIKQCKDDFLAFALNELRGGMNESVQKSIAPEPRKIYTHDDYLKLVKKFGILLSKPNVAITQLEKENADLKAASAKHLQEATALVQDHIKRLEEENTSLQAQITVQASDVKQAATNANSIEDLELRLSKAEADLQTAELLMQCEQAKFAEEKAEMETRLTSAKLLIDEAGKQPNIGRAVGPIYMDIMRDHSGYANGREQINTMLTHPICRFGISYQIVQQEIQAKENQRLNSKIIRLEATINRHTAVVADLQQQLTESKKHASSLQCAIDGYNIERLRTGWQVAPTYVPGVNQVVAANIVAALKDMTALVKAAGYEISKEINDCKKLKAHEMNVQEAIVFIKELKRQHPSNQAANISLDTVHTALTRSREVCILFFSFLFFPVLIPSFQIR